MEKNEIHKLSWFSSVLKHGKWYIFSSFIAKGFNILVLRVYTSYLSPSEFGILETLNSIAQLLPFLISLSLDAAFARFYHDYKNNDKKLNDLFSTIYLFILGFGMLIIILFITSSQLWLNDFLEIPFFPHILIAFVPPLFFQLGSLGLSFLRQSLKSKTTTIVEISSIIVNISVAIPLLIFADFGILAKLFGNFAMSLGLFLFYTIFFIKNGMLSLNFDKQILIDSLHYSIPLLPIVAGSWISGFSDRLVIANYQNLESVGLYSIGFTLGKLLYVFQDAITQVIGPISMSGLIHDKENTTSKIADASLKLWVLLLFFNLGMYLFAKELVMIFAGKTFEDSSLVIPIIGFTYVLGCQQRIFSTVLMFHKKNWIISIGGIMQAVLNLCLNIYFVPIYGYIMAALTSVFSVLLYSIWIIYWVLRLENFDIKVVSYFKPFFILVVFQFLYYCSPVENFFVKLLIYMLSGITLYLFIGRKLNLRY